MRAPATVLPAAAIAFAACSHSPAAQPQAETCAPAYASVARFVDSTAQRHGASGAALLLVRGDQVLCEHYYGAYDAGRALPAASASKWMTAVAILALVDEGRLSLDEPISTRLPYFTGAAASITLRQLLSHTSGLASGQACLFDSRTTLDACSRQIAATPPLYAPGTEFRYAGASFTVAGRLAEVAAGESWNQLFAGRVGTPLGWRETGWEGANPLLSGGASATVPEYARMLRMLLAGGTYGGRRVLSAAALAELARDNVRGAPMTDTPRTQVYGYGLGVWRDAVDAAGSATQLSSPGASGFYPWIDLQRNLAGIVVLPSRDEIDNYWYGATLDVQAQVRRIADAQ